MNNDNDIISRQVQMFELSKHIEAGFSSKTYSYMQNCEYTQIEYVESYIDTFAVTTVYLKGDVSEEDAIRLFEYKEGLADVDMKEGYIYEKEGMKIRY